MNFSSENYDGAHPDMLNAIISANEGFVASYGEDSFTREATETFKKVLQRDDIEVRFCFNGTGANNFAVGTLTKRHQSILCSDVSHIYNAESTAPEAFSGCRLYPVRTDHGKIIISDILSRVSTLQGIHCPPAALLTISQPTEYGTVYTLNELKAIARVCKQNNLLLHVDGARLFNALAAMECSISEFVEASQVDALTIGGTKSGLLFGEAVVFFANNRFDDIRAIHKRSMQLASKNRFIASQFNRILKDGLWKTIAGHSNELAGYFTRKISAIKSTRVLHPVETNMVFMEMDDSLFRKLKAVSGFYQWDTLCNEVRFVFSFSNTREEIDLFIEKYKEAVGGIK